MSGVLIMAGGTGGHVFPGLAVARRLRGWQIKVTWLGTRHGLEARIVPAAALGIQMEWITIRGVRRTGVINWLFLPWTLGVALIQAFKVLRRVRPAVVLSMGGFTAGPGGIVAWLMRTPLLIHEQNAIPGLTNRALACVAEQVLTGFPGAFPHRTPLSGQRRLRYTGNPVRAEIAAIPVPSIRLKATTDPLRLLIVGGSQGAGVFNAVVPQALGLLDVANRPQVWHQCGRATPAEVERTYQALAVNARVAPFIDNMAEAYAWADLVLCRAGAMTVAELCAAGCAAILVPYLHAVDDHQTANARFLSERNAAVLLPQTELTPERLADLLRRFTARRDLILKAAQNARALSKGDADEQVANVCLEYLNA